MRLVWDAYLNFERSRMHALRAMDVHQRRQAAVCCIFFPISFITVAFGITPPRSVMATIPLPTFHLPSVPICESCVPDMRIRAVDIDLRYSVGRLHCLKPLTPQELVLITPKAIARAAPMQASHAALPAEKNVSMMPLPPRQDLPSMYVRKGMYVPTNRRFTRLFF